MSEKPTSILADEAKRTPQFFIDDESGEGWQLFGHAGNIQMAVENAMAYVQATIDMLLEDEDQGGKICLAFKRKDMSEQEVAALPEV